jgi:4-amino-4-deoxy-L-arabinose transferase-like glycosyltransferase
VDIQDSRIRPATWAVVAWVVVFWRLGTPALFDPDEAHYAQLTREMIQAGNWLVPLLDGFPYIDKPVLFHWVQALAVAVLGETELAMRLPSALAAVALFGLMWWAGKQLFGEQVADRGALMFATIPLTFALSSIGVFDMVFSAFLFGAVACLIVAALRGRPHLQYAGYVLLALAVMTKGPVALVLVSLFFAAGLCCGRACRDALLSLRWKTGFTFVALASLPWFVWMWMTFGDQFVEHYLFAGNLYYLTKPEFYSSRANNQMLYVATFLAGFFPWSLVALGGALDTLWRWRQKDERRPEEILLWLWVAVVFVFFQIARFKLDRYVYPAAPACCLLAGRAWLSASIARRDHATARDNFGVRAAIAVLGGLLISVGALAGFLLFQLGLELPGSALAIPISLAAGGLAVSASMLRRQLVSPAVFRGLVTSLLVIYGSFVIIGFPLLERVRPTAQLARELRSQLGERDQVALYRLDRWRSSLRYYLGRPVDRLEHPHELQEFLARSSDGYILMLSDDFARLREEGIRLRAVDQRPAVTGTTGYGLRWQKWGSLVVATLDRSLASSF